MTQSKRLDQTLEFALKAHGSVNHGEKYKNLRHPIEVQRILDKNGFHSLKFMMAALLHDTLHERVATYAEVKKIAGKEVAEMIFAITYELGRSRKESMRRTWWKVARNKDALTLKLADYIANVRFWSSFPDETPRIKMYRLEYKSFRRLMLHRVHDRKLWLELDSLLR